MVFQQSSRILTIIGIFLVWLALGVSFYQESPEDTPTIVTLLDRLR